MVVKSIGGVLPDSSPYWNITAPFWVVIPSGPYKILPEADSLIEAATPSFIIEKREIPDISPRLTPEARYSELIGSTSPKLMLTNLEAVMSPELPFKIIGRLLVSVSQPRPHAPTAEYSAKSRPKLVIAVTGGVCMNVPIPKSVPVLASKPVGVSVPIPANNKFIAVASVRFIPSRLFRRTEALAVELVVSVIQSESPPPLSWKALPTPRHMA